MTRHSKLLMTVLTALLLLSIGAGASFALRSLSIEGERQQTLTGTVTIVVEPATIRCNVTVVKTISRQFPKIEGTLIGKITDYRLERCVTEGGTLNFVFILGLEVEELWRIFYKQFLGTLPRITGLLFEWRNLQKLLEIRTIFGNIACLYEGTIGLLARVTPEGIIERLRTLDEQPALIEKRLLRTLVAPCPRTMRLRYELTPMMRPRIVLL